MKEPSSAEAPTWREAQFGQGEDTPSFGLCRSDVVYLFVRFLLLFLRVRAALFLLTARRTQLCSSGETWGPKHKTRGIAGS